MSKNRMAILRGFDRLRAAENQTAFDGIRKIGENALDLVVQFHREYDGSMIHINEDNTLAYAVAYDGATIESRGYLGGDYDMPGEASQEAEDILSSTKGYAAIVLSDMTQDWYNATLELDFLTRARDQIESNINNYFTTLPR